MTLQDVIDKAIAALVEASEIQKRILIKNLLAILKTVLPIYIPSSTGKKNEDTTDDDIDNLSHPDELNAFANENKAEAIEQQGQEPPG
jgi:hypothetical protein